ncbi:hypothetical protein SAMN02745133_00464 [Desulforamulus putei DSM 12395]|uniref:Uncharacterized protein n=1 Tax=Desulforamulus putei DSM 12395 TaxID=1121429 RepID=A0A1M4TU57_9FIRM|nr:hypothetical protein [Desulforamulus putei]SHE47958.1 hypothetical protein SAMN02745133_00464 [Desulforamulus putei DSM 12395]
MGGVIIYPEIIGTLADSCFLVVPALKKEMARYAERRALGEEVGYRIDWNLVIVRSLEICIITLDILWDDGNITVIGFHSKTWDQLSQFMHFSNLLLLPDRGLIGEDNNLISPVAAQEGFLIKGIDKGLVSLANKAANISPDLNVRGLMTYLSDILNVARKTGRDLFLS